MQQAANQYDFTDAHQSKAVEAWWGNVASGTKSENQLYGGLSYTTTQGLPTSISYNASAVTNSF